MELWVSTGKKVRVYINLIKMKMGQIKHCLVSEKEQRKQGKVKI